MLVVLTLYLIYAFTVLILCGCSLTQTPVEYISDELLHEWSVNRNDLILFELLPEARASQAVAMRNFLAVTPAKLKFLTAWIPAGSRVVFYNNGLPQASVEYVNRLLVRTVSCHVYWLETQKESVAQASDAWEQ